ncbi:MAG: hypothetical protein V4710_19660, partial [Verrucomicrobiota bacterium]
MKQPKIIRASDRILIIELSAWSCEPPPFQSTRMHQTVFRCRPLLAAFAILGLIVHVFAQVNDMGKWQLKWITLKWITFRRRS